MEEHCCAQPRQANNMRLSRWLRRLSGNSGQQPAALANHRSLWASVSVNALQLD
jgi:hypothetical protein